MSSADNSVARGQESSSASSAFVSPFSGFFRAPMPESLRVGAPGTFDHVLTRVDNHPLRSFFPFISSRSRTALVSTANNFFLLLV